MYGLHTFFQKLGKAFPFNLSALLIFKAPIGFIHNVDRQNILSVLVPFSEFLSLLKSNIRHFTVSSGVIVLNPVISSKARRHGDFTTADSDISTE